MRRSLPPTLMNPEEVSALEAHLGYRFRDEALLARALTHSSYAHEHPPTAHNEPLALLGDAALSLVVAEHLYGRASDPSVGALTRERADVVSGTNLARWAESLGLGEMVQLGRGEEQTGGRSRASILATTIEAVLGAIYLDGGLDAVRSAVRRLAVR